MDYGPVSDEKKAEIVTRFLLHAPPGEFTEVFNDVRTLLNNDALFKDRCSGSVAQYNKDQFTPVRLPGAELATIVCEQNELQQNHQHSSSSSSSSTSFFDPRSKQLFRYDHIRKEASDQSSMDVDSRIEPWRAALEQAVDVYIKNHYRYGVSAVFGKYATIADTSSLSSASSSTSPGRSSGGGGADNEKIVLTVCLEAHQFQSKNYWNGRWRSQWRVCFSPHSGASAELLGVIRVQVHYYEDGNVQLMSTKHAREAINVTTEAETAKSIVSIIMDAENDYQRGVNENYQNMSDTTFKALRRQLPVTRSKIDWAKIAGYKIGTELGSRGDTVTTSNNNPSHNNSTSSTTTHHTITATMTSVSVHTK